MTSFIIGISVGMVIGMSGVLLAVFTMDKKMEKSQKKLDFFSWLC
jgi:NhaP-type Na+/H+ or K+/H+ antiporter